MTIKWNTSPTTDDLADAAKYLKTINMCFRGSTTELLLAKDLLRASTLPCLPEDSPGVEKYLERYSKGTAISPVLLVRGAGNIPLIIAEGYHRVCAAYILAEDTPVRTVMSERVFPWNAA